MINFSGISEIEDLSEEIDKEEFSISNNGKGYSDLSGMHKAPPESSWNYPTIGEPIEKEAIGLFDIPGSLDGGEVLNFKGIPQNPGLSRETGDGESIDFFGGEYIEDLPPGNEEDNVVKYQKINFFDFINNSEVEMNKELEELEKELLSLGKDNESFAVKFLKEAVGPVSPPPKGLGGGRVDYGNVRVRKEEKKPLGTFSVESPINEEVSYSSPEQMVELGLLDKNELDYLMNSGLSYTVDVLKKDYKLTDDQARQLQSFLLKDVQSVNSKVEKKKSKFRFPRVGAVMEVQEMLGTNPDGYWGVKTDEAWNSRVRELSKEWASVSGSDFSAEEWYNRHKAGGFAFPRDIKDAHKILQGPEKAEKAIELAKVEEESSSNTPDNTPSDSPVAVKPDNLPRNVTKRIELSLRDPRKGTPNILSFISGDSSRRGVALIEWPMEDSPSKRYDTIVQMPNGNWELGAATRREMRALRKPQIKSVRKEMRRERRDLSRKQKRQQRKMERQRRRSASEVGLRMKSRSKKYLK